MDSQADLESSLSHQDVRVEQIDRRALRAFADQLAHRLLGLVNGIESYTDMLADTLGTDEQRELSLRILEGTTRIERLVADLRRYAQPVEPVVRTLDIEELIQGLGEFLSTDKWSRVKVNTESGAPSELAGDPMLIRQALLALIQNAFEAASSIEAPDRAENVRLAISYDSNSGVTEVRVWSASYIEEAEPAERVFEPFYSTKTSHLGIGLSLARRIAEAHCGTLSLSSTDAKNGTEFSLRLPCSHDHSNEMLELD